LCVAAGRITVDGLDLTMIDPVWLRSSMALVAQEPVLFDGSIRYNIAYGVGGDLADDAMRACAVDANAHEFITSFPDGYDTLVGERGVKLSGGQKQRIAIARALALQPRILLLDEATSALDAESEHVVQEALEKAMGGQGRTTMVIAHRLSTVKSADVVAVIDKGALVERGTHDELLAMPDGVYRALVERQLEHA
jgi:ATP-binding cassette subfamily B (MDR/TAP) protein 1